MILDNDINALFIDFEDLDEALYKFKSKYASMLMNILENYNVELKEWVLTTDVTRWCKENHIKYRKVEVGNILNGDREIVENIGKVQKGLLFYSTEDATAFKLRWT